MSATRDRIKQILIEPKDGHPADTLLKEFVIIHRDDLPEVNRSQHDTDTYLSEGESICYTSVQNAHTWAMRDVAVWQFLEKEAAAIARRRDELAAEFTAVDSYASQLPYTRKLIDRIVELEGKVS